MIIGAIGGIICTAGLRLLERLQLDDVVGAVPAHLFAGIWGTLAASIVAGANIGVQLLGVVSVGVFVFGVSWVLWQVLARTLSVRVEPSVRAPRPGRGRAGHRGLP